MPPASASQRSPPRRVFSERKRRANDKRRKWSRARNERRYEGPTGGKEASRVTRSVRPGHRRARSSRQHSAPGGEVPRSRVAGARQTEVSSAENFGGSLGRTDEWAGNDRGAVGASVLEDGGWSVARHLEVIPETKVSSVTPSGSGRICGNGRETRMEERSDYPNSGRSQGEVNRHGIADLPSAGDPELRRRKRQRAKEKAKAAIERRQGIQNEQRQWSKAWLAGRSDWEHASKRWTMYRQIEIRSKDGATLGK